MKKWIWAVLIFLVAGVVGGYAVAHYHEEQVQYERNITNGKTAQSVCTLSFTLVIIYAVNNQRKTIILNLFD